MFEEFPFEDNMEEEEVKGKKGRGSSFSSSKAESATNIVVRFHKPGDPEFSAVAGAHTEQDANFNPQLFNGDSWLSSECHCLKCEGIRLVEKYCAFHPKERMGVITTSSLISPPLSSNVRRAELPVLVLLDLDNFGFRQFQLMPPRLDKFSSSKLDEKKVALMSNDEIFSQMFMWGFFGSCFTRYHQVWPTEDLLLNLSPPLLSEGERNISVKKADNPPSLSNSIWKKLILQKKLLLTPCSGGRQGADMVLRQVVQAFSSSFDIVVITGDVELMELLQHDQRGKPRKRARSGLSNNDEETESCSSDGEKEIRFICISSKEKKLIPVWAALAHEISSLRRPKEGERRRKRNRRIE